MRKTRLRMISALLGVVLTFTNPMQAFAAAKHKYVSNVILSYGNTDEEAKKWLTDNGYEIVDKNLNENADSIFDKARAVYMGYRTTNNADEAITDMKTMNMNGDYSFDKYEEVLKQQETNIQNFVNEFIVTVQEYRENYNKKNPRAVAAHDILNLYVDDLEDTSGQLLGTNQKLGDLLLDPIKQEMSDAEYEKLTDTQKMCHADLVEMLMRGNSEALELIEQNLALASDCGDSTWMERLSDIGGLDAMFDSYELANRKKTASQINQMLVKEYDDKAMVLAEKLDAFSEAAIGYMDCEVHLDDSAERVDSYFASHTEESKESWVSIGTVCEEALQYEYDDGVLYDILTDKDANYKENAENRMLLYPILAAMSDGQLAALDYLNVQQMIWMAMDSDADAMNQAQLNLQDIEPISVYTGINQALFEGGIALTEKAQQEQASTGEYYTEYFYENVSASTMVATATTAVFGIAALLSNRGPKNVSEIVSNKLTQQADELTKLWAQNPWLKDMPAGRFEYWPEGYRAVRTGVFGETIEKGELINNADLAAVEKESELMDAFDVLNTEDYQMTRQDVKFMVEDYEKIQNAQSVSRYLSISLNFVFAVLAVWAVVSLVIDLIDYYNTDLTEIPHFIAERAEQSETDVRKFTLYEVVRCNRQEMGMEPADNEVELLKDYGDLNGDIGKEWVALYTTKDSSAGNPITTDFVVQYGDSKVPLGKKSLTMFSYANPVNLIDEHYVYEGETSDGKQGIYLFYTQEKNANLTGTAQSSGLIAVICGIGLLAIGGSAAAFYTVRKKKKQN